MGTKLLMSMAFHPQMDGAIERANRLIAQILQTVVDNDQKNWSEKCSMAEFAINSSINATTGYAPFELNYRYMLRSGQHIFTNTTFKGVEQFAQQALWNLIDSHNVILEHRVMQTHYLNKHQRPGVIYHGSDMVYLSTKNLALPRGRARKLMPRFLGPYKVLKAMNDSSNVTLELPPELKIGEFLLHSTPTWCDHMSRIMTYCSPKEKQNHTMILATMTNRNGLSIKY